MERTKWLACTASPGQFRDELAIHGEDYEGREFSLFAGRQFVRSERNPTGLSETPARLQTVLLEERDGLCLVLLPSRTFDNGSTITVRDEQLTSSVAPEYA